jgi:hypothetical protein
MLNPDPGQPAERPKDKTSQNQPSTQNQLMKIPCFLISLVPLLPLLFCPLTRAAEAIQTQPATEGSVEVDVIKATVNEGILTVQLAYRNTGSEKVGILYALENVYYIDEKDKKKYHVLRDSQNAWIATLECGGNIAHPRRYGDSWPVYGDSWPVPVEVQGGGKTIVWFKFPAPPPSTAKINLIVSKVMPFKDLQISQ